MIQQIGIDVSATGAQQIATEFSQISRSLSNFQRDLNQFNTAMKSMNTRIESFYTKASILNSVGAHFSSFGQKATSAVAGVSKEMDKLAASIKSVNTLTGAAGGSRGGTGSSGGMFGGLLGGAMGPFGFMARFMAFHEALRGAQYGMRNVVMGGSREEIAKANMDMAAVSANADQRAFIEKQGHAFASKYGVIQTPEFIKTAAQTASALEIEKLGAGTISQITEQNIIGAKMTSMNQSAFAEAQSKIMSSYLSRFDASVGETLKSGGTVTLPEFGRVNLQQMHGKIVAMTAKVVEKTNIWGQGLMDFYSYAGSMAGEKGMPLADIFAMGGVLSDLGFKGAKSGRALKSMLAGQADPLANVMMIGEGKYKTGMSKEEKQAFDAERKSYAARINELSKTSEGQAQLAKLLAPGLSKAMAMSENPDYALSLTKDLGISQDFLPQILALYKDASAKAIKNLVEHVKNAGMEELVGKFGEATQDAGWQLQKLNANWSGFITSLTTSVNNLIGDFAESSGLTAALKRGKELFDKHNLDNKNKEALEKLDKRGKGGTGDYSNVSGEDIMNLGGPESVIAGINKLQSEKLKDQWGLAKTDEEREELRKNAIKEGRELYQKFYWGSDWEKERESKLKAIQDSGESPDPLTPEIYSEYGIPYNTNAPDAEFLWKQDTVGARHNLSNAQERAKRILGPSYMGDGAHSPQDKGGSDTPFFNEAPIVPELRAETPNIELNPTFKIVAYLGDREIRDIVMEVQHEGRWSGDTTTPGAGFVS